MQNQKFINAVVMIPSLAVIFIVSIIGGLIFYIFGMAIDQAIGIAILSIIAGLIMIYYLNFGKFRITIFVSKKGTTFGKLKIGQKFTGPFLNEPGRILYKTDGFITEMIPGVPYEIPHGRAFSAELRSYFHFPHFMPVIPVD